MTGNGSEQEKELLVCVAAF